MLYILLCISYRNIMIAEICCALHYMERNMELVHFHFW